MYTHIWQDSIDAIDSSRYANLTEHCSCHPGVSQTRCGINVYTLPQVDVKLGVPSSSISWWTLKIPWCPEYASYRWSLGQVPALSYRGHCLSGTVTPL